MKVSIIIAVKEFNPFLKECIEKCLKLASVDYEIIVLPDVPFKYDNPRIRVIATGACLPAKKRDLGSEQANGEILGFLDDDAYPASNWLDEAVKNFSDPDVAAVGGPAVTPPTEEFSRMASGLIYESFAVSGNFRYRYLRAKKRFVDDYPSCNFLVRKDIFKQLGGFKTNFWPGEDTILCLEVTRRLSKKIVYDPAVLVFHHRRPIFPGHLNQIKNYALHRGYFVKHFPETSLKWQYFIPSLFLIWLMTGLFFSLLSHTVMVFYLVSILFYGIFIFLNAIQRKDTKMTLAVTLGIFLTHLTYGLYFLAGLLKRRLREEL